MKRKRSVGRVLALIIVLGALIALIVYAFFFRDRDTGIKVTVSDVGRRTITQSVSATGTIQPETQVKISSETSGEIIFLGAQDGDTVKKGALLVRIKPDFAETQLEQASASAASAKARMLAAKAELERNQITLQNTSELYKKEFASKDEFDQARFALDQSSANYDAAVKEYERAFAAYKQSEVSASRTVIYAPISGVVTSVSVEKGEKVVGTGQMQGTEIMRIADLEIMNALVDVDENDVVLISVGDTARVEFDAFPDTLFNALVYQIANSARRSGLGTQDEVVNFEIRIRLLDVHPRFRPGMSCNTEIETETRVDVIAVPLQSVTLRQIQELGRKQDDTTETNINRVALGGNEPRSVVFLNEGNIVRMQQVETGISDNGFIEVLDGLDEGISVVTGSFRAIHKDLEDSSRVRIDNARIKRSNSRNR